MMQTDRGHYCPLNPYEDAPQPIGFGQTISAPHMHAAALELASHLRDGATVLDVGSGSGYLSACLARLVSPTGRVLGIDVVPGLVAYSINNVRKADADLLDRGILRLRDGDGWQGAPNDVAAPFDYIHVGAAAPRVPKALLAQLKDGGKLVIPVGPDGGSQELMQITRDGAKFHAQSLMGVRYVPLVQSMP
ncbi:Aste57867_16485 [Aphanomyces stellatus]|uniref:protein-L-isoaspartate(D-aspartate) O-methyltransferase n=1 Tax=Aphanomyces stellatus TaxID=120398 RepID=A0A485L7G5_9STRA|nr:hypothetical protein As57867_016428 [Aphanomyces stellatus]KAF0694123.1 hypothetical protein As57867_014907 [Aphanomyces stellatus]VFT91777.1 Aste57867_14963 [Aphanomyces stellatus]VFT93259.1 Aste57867_16485 [Aphanomyces stellatus]